MLYEAATIVAFFLVMIAFSYAFVQRSRFFILPEGVFIGGFTAFSLFQIYKSLKASALDFIGEGQWWLIFPIIIGLLAYARLTKFRWVARYPVSVLSGAGAGVLFGLTVRGQFWAPISDTAAAVANTAFDPISRALFVVILIPIIILFLYSRTFSQPFHDRRGTLYYIQRIGRIAFFIIVGYQIHSPNMLGGVPVLFQTTVKPFIDLLIGGG